MATGSILTVCNRSLLAIGSQSQISNLQEGSTQADACNTLFQSTFENLARAAYWNCLTAQATLTLLAAAQGTPENPQGTTLPLPPTPWLYMYQIPSDSLAARYIVPSVPTTGTSTISPAYRVAPTWLGGQQQIPFRVAYATDSTGNPLQVILTNQTQAILVYTVNQSNPQIWDSEFQQAMVASLAAFLVPALALNMPLMQIQIKLANDMIANARMRDGNEGSTDQSHIPDWIVARDSGGGYGYQNGYGYGSYNDMYWPAG